MKTICLTTATLLFVSFSSLHAQDSEFAGVEQSMSSQAFQQAGLNKLTPAERARLDDYIRTVTAKSSERAATAAVDRAVHDQNAVAPKVIQSRIVGPFKGYDGRTTFTLENGQRWAQSQRDSAFFPVIDSPPVLIIRETIGHRMYIAGGGAIRVSQLK